MYKRHPPVGVLDKMTDFILCLDESFHFVDRTRLIVL